MDQEKSVYPEHLEVLYRFCCSKAISPDSLPRINQRREVEADNIHLQFCSIVVLNHGANCDPRISAEPESIALSARYSRAPSNRIASLSDWTVERPLPR